MKFLQNMSPGTKKLLLIGIPIVAVIAFVVLVKKSSSASSTTSTTSTTPAGAAVSDTGVPVDSGQLASYESTVSDQLAQIQSSLGQGSTLDGSSSTPPATPTSPTPGSDAWTYQGSGVSYTASGGGPLTSVTSTEGQTFAPVYQPAALAAAQEAGAQPYFSPAPGEFVSTKGTTLAPGTPQYLLDGQ